LLFARAIYQAGLQMQIAEVQVSAGTIEYEDAREFMERTA